MLDIERYRTEVAGLCRQLKVRRLDLFGSAAREDCTDESDVDVLVQFDSDGGGLFDRYFDLKEGLEAVFGRPVDVVIEKSLKNPYFKASIESSRRNLYAA
ncbi:MAG: nucleotidyltransferase family protein [Planctomycetota bacterium]|jgi:predicted nucleotidyltransferase